MKAFLFFDAGANVLKMQKILFIHTIPWRREEKPQHTDKRGRGKQKEMQMDSILGYWYTLQMGAFISVISNVSLISDMQTY